MTKAKADQADMPPPTDTPIDAPAGDHPREGGSYVRQKDGTLQRQES